MALYWKSQKIRNYFQENFLAFDLHQIYENFIKICELFYGTAPFIKLLIVTPKH